MNYVSLLYEKERNSFSSCACLSENSGGRCYGISECNLRGAFQRDRDRIIHSKAFRRLMGKTQVFLAPEPDHYRTRLTHTMEVTQIARTIARALRLNEDLREAIGLGTISGTHRSVMPESVYFKAVLTVILLITGRAFVLSRCSNR